MKQNILIIEDEENIARAQELILSAKYSTSIAKDGAEGLNKARKLKPDLIILDLMLPKVNGIEICRRIKADDDLRDVKVVMVTAKNQSIDELRGMDIGADDYIMKPFEAEELMHVVSQVLKQ